MNRKNIFLFLLSLLVSLPAFCADNASSVLDRAARKISSSKSIKAAYTLSSQGAASTSGTLTLAGDKFVMTAPQMTIWYDGTTQWVYLKDDNEVNVTEPTAEELLQVNPFVIINSFKQAYTAKMISDTKTLKKIALTARSTKSDIRSATITLNASTLMPVEISVKMASGHTATIKITSLTTGKQLPLSTFRFNAKAYPGAEVIDLR